jgi:probable rRNA maturation factor
MADLNHRFRGKPQPTDVLSFPVDPGENGYLGDVVISAETARRNARRSGRSLREELRILILHGVLHLLGYNHETDRGQMNRLERKLRRVWELR